MNIIKNTHLLRLILLINKKYAQIYINIILVYMLRLIFVYIIYIDINIIYINRIKNKHKYSIH